MRKDLLWAAIVALAALIQTTWLDAINVQGVLPDLTLVMVVYFAVAVGEERAMFTGVLGGLYQDVVGQATLGHHVLGLVVVGYIVGRVARRLVTEHAAVKAGLVLCAALVHGLIFTTIQYIQTPEMSASYALLNKVVPGAIYTALVTPILFFFLGWVFRPPRESLQGGTP